MKNVTLQASVSDSGSAAYVIKSEFLNYPQTRVQRTLIWLGTPIPKRIRVPSHPESEFSNPWEQKLQELLSNCIKQQIRVPLHLFVGSSGNSYFIKLAAGNLIMIPSLNPSPNQAPDYLPWSHLRRLHNRENQNCVSKKWFFKVREVVFDTCI